MASPIDRRWLVALGLFLAQGAALAQQLYWYDGAVRRPLWSEPGVVADFEGAAREKSSVIKPSALVKPGAGGQSGVFRDHASASGASPRALPGGVILRFKPDTAEAERADLIARHGLTVVRELAPGSGTLLVASPPGEASLTLANRLYESGQFAAASPNWWQARRLK